MDKDHKQIFLNAISDGYLTIPANRDSILNLKHRLDCIERNLPIIQLLMAGDYAVLAAENEPFGYPVSLQALLSEEFDIKFFRMSAGKPLIVVPADQGKLLARRLYGIGIGEIDRESGSQLVLRESEERLKSPFRKSIAKY